MLASKVDVCIISLHTHPRLHQTSKLLPADSNMVHVFMTHIFHHVLFFPKCRAQNHGIPGEASAQCPTAPTAIPFHNHHIRIAAREHPSDNMESCDWPKCSETRTDMYREQPLEIPTRTHGFSMTAEREFGDVR